MPGRLSLFPGGGGGWRGLGGGSVERNAVNTRGTMSGEGIAVSRQSVLSLFRHLLRSGQRFPTVEGRCVIPRRIRAAFRENAQESNPAEIGKMLRNGNTHLIYLQMNETRTNLAFPASPPAVACPSILRKNSIEEDTLPTVDLTDLINNILPHPATQFYVSVQKPGYDPEKLFDVEEKLVNRHIFARDRDASNPPPETDDFTLNYTFDELPFSSWNAAQGYSPSASHESVVVAEKKKEDEFYGKFLTLLRDEVGFREEDEEMFQESVKEEIGRYEELARRIQEQAAAAAAEGKPPKILMPDWKTPRVPSAGAPEGAAASAHGSPDELAFTDTDATTGAGSDQSKPTFASSAEPQAMVAEEGQGLPPQEWTDPSHRGRRM